MTIAVNGQQTLTGFDDWIASRIVRAERFAADDQMADALKALAVADEAMAALFCVGGAAWWLEAHRRVAAAREKLATAIAATEESRTRGRP